MEIKSGHLYQHNDCLSTMCAWLIQLSLLGLFLHATTAVAEVILDGSLGPAGPLLGPDFEISADLGQQKGANLFHSFSEFDLERHQSATFLGPPTVRHIIGRITSGTLSKINGRLSSQIPQADLYLMNPYGFAFGPQATLDLQGSLQLTTASQLELGTQGVFDSLHPERSLLVSAPPTAFGFLAPQAAAIEIEGCRLAPPEGESLSLFGGHLRISEGGWLRAVSGRINLAATGAAQRLRLTANSFQLDSAHELGDITIEGHASIDTGKQGAGDIYIRGGQFVLKDSEIIANTTDRPGGVIALGVKAFFLQGATIDSSALGTEAGGQVVIQVENQATLTQNSQIVTAARSSIEQHAGNAGNINLTAYCLTLEDNSAISTTTFGSGRGGSISLDIKDTLQLRNQASISAGSHNGIGDAGSITINAQQFKMTDSAISTATDRADGGNIIIALANRLALNQSQITTAVSGGLGNGGNIALGSPQFLKLEDSKISASARGGNGGLVLIISGLPMERVNSTLEAASEEGLDGQIEIDIPHVDINALPTNFLDASLLIKKHCSARFETPLSRFIVVGRDNLPNAPHDLQSYIPALCCSAGHSSASQ